MHITSQNTRHCRNQHKWQQTYEEELNKAWFDCFLIEEKPIHMFVSNEYSDGQLGAVDNFRH